MPAHNKELVDAYRRVAQGVLADYNLDPAEAYRWTPDELNQAIARQTERTDFDVRALLRKEGWSEEELERLEVMLAVAGQPQIHVAGDFPNLDTLPHHR